MKETCPGCGPFDSHIEIYKGHVILEQGVTSIDKGDLGPSGLEMGIRPDSEG